MNFFNKTIKTAIVGAMLWAVAQGVVAQPLPGEQVDVLRTFKATLDNTDKLRVSPTLPDVTDKVATLVYDIPLRLLNLTYEPPVIRPLTFPREAPPKAYRFFAKAGYGTPNSPYGEARYNGTADNLHYGIFAKHHSANRAALEHQRFAKTQAGANATYYLDNIAVGGKIGYSLDQVHFYGYDHATDTFVRDSVRQRFSLVNGGVELFNSQRTSNDLGYKASLNFYRLTDHFTAGETGISVQASATKWFGDHPLTVELSNDYAAYQATVSRSTNNVLKVKPSFTYTNGGFQVTVGGNLGIDSAFFVFPRLEASANVLEEKLVVMAGWTGDVQQNTFKTLTQYNPYVLSDVGIRNTRFQKFYGGVKGGIAKINYEAVVSYKPTTALATFLNDTADSRRFAVAYYNFNIFSIHGGVAVREWIDNLDITFGIDLNTYTHPTQAGLIKAWHLPQLDLNATAAYQLLDDKLQLNAALFVLGPMPYLDAAGLDQNLASLLDLSAGATFQATENIGIFLQLNNLTNQQYQRWNLYPNYGFNLLGGITARF